VPAGDSGGTAVAVPK